MKSLGARPKINSEADSQDAESDFRAVESDSVAQSAADRPFLHGFVGRVSKGMGALSLGSAVNIISQITIVPVALYAWGKFRYGEWILLTGLVQLVRLTDLGLQTYVMNRLCGAHAQQDRRELQHVLHSAVRVQLSLVLAVYGAIAIALVTVPWVRVLGLQTISGARLVVLGLLLSGELLLGVPMGTIAGVYRATGHLARAAVIGACQQFCILILTLLLIGTDASFPVVAAGRLLVVLLTSAWVLYDLRRLHPWLRIWPRDASWKEGITFILPGLFFLLIPLADYFATQITLLVTQRVLAGGEVSRLATHRTIANFGQMASALLTTAIWPELTALHALDQKATLSRVHRTLAKFNLWLVSAMAFGLLPFLPIIYPLWTAKTLILDAWTLGLLFSRLMLWGIWYSSLTVLAATNRHYRLGLLLLLEGALTGAMSIFLVPMLGIKGVALSTFIADLAVCAWAIPLQAVREMGDSLLGFLGNSAKALLVVVVPVASGVAAWTRFPNLFLQYGIIVPLCVMVAGGMMLWQLNEPERRLLRDLRTRFTNALRLWNFGEKF